MVRSSFNIGINFVKQFQYQPINHQQANLVIIDFIDFYSTAQNIKCNLKQLLTKLQIKTYKRLVNIQTIGYSVEKGQNLYISIAIELSLVNLQHQLPQLKPFILQRYYGEYQFQQKIQADELRHKLQKHIKKSFLHEIYQQQKVLEISAAIAKTDLTGLHQADSQTTESAKSKNIPKNIAKVIISMILNTKLCDQQIQNKKQFVTFIKKNKNIQNLETLLRLSRPHKNPEIDVHHKTFRKICYYFLKTQFIQYVFNSKIKDPQWHICYRNDLINIFRKLN